MTMTVKLDPEMEQALRQCSAAQRRPASALIRDALGEYLAKEDNASLSAHALGADLFGRYRGPKDLAARRKAVMSELVNAKHPARSKR